MRGLTEFFRSDISRASRVALLVVALAAASMISWCVGGLALGKKLFSARAS